MNITASEAEIAAAAAYEDFFVKGLFGEWASRVLDAARVYSDQQVLDVACGTGILAREAEMRVGIDGSVTGLDPNPGMLAVAERQTPGVDWKQGVAESLPFPDHRFDIVVSQFGLMFFRDPGLAVTEMMRVLKPAGRFAVAVWDSLAKIPAYRTAVALLDRIAGQQAADALRAPFVLGDRDKLAGLFEKDKLELTEIQTLKGAARFPSIRSMVEADLKGWLPVLDVVLAEDLIERILKEAEVDLAPFRDDAGGVVFETSAHIICGTKPAA